MSSLFICQCQFFTGRDETRGGKNRCKAFFSVDGIHARESTRTSSSSVSKVLLAVQPAEPSSLVSRGLRNIDFQFAFSQQPVMHHISKLQTITRREADLPTWCHSADPINKKEKKREKERNDNVPVKTKSRLPRVKYYDEANDELVAIRHGKYLMASESKLILYTRTFRKVFVSYSASIDQTHTYI